MSIKYEGTVYVMHNGGVLSKYHNSGMPALFTALQQLFKTPSNMKVNGCLPSSVDIVAGVSDVAVLSDKIPIEQKTCSVSTDEYGTTLEMVHLGTFTANHLNRAITMTTGNATLRLYNSSGEMLCTCLAADLMDKIAAMNSEDQIHILWKLEFTDKNNSTPLIIE